MFLWKERCTAGDVGKVKFHKRVDCEGLMVYKKI